MTTLRDLLEQAKRKHGQTSGRALAELAARHNLQIDRTQVNAILGGTYKSKPRKPLLEAVAWLAGVPVEQAYEAAELPMPGPPFADELPPGVDDLDPQQRHAVITVIRAFLGSAEQEGGGERDRSAAMNLPTLRGAQDRRRRKAVEQGLPQKEAAYTEEPADD